MYEPALIKQNGTKQRIDVGLTQEVANALGDLVLAGKSLYPKSGKLTIVMTEGETEKSLVLAVGTLTTWITRGNVIPETGEPLRVFLDAKREEKRIGDEQRRQASILDNAEQLIEQVVKNDPVETVEFYKVDEAGKHTLSRVQKVKNSARMIEARVKAATFGLERLNPNLYGARIDLRANVDVFNLSEIRKARDEAIREGNT